MTTKNGNEVRYRLDQIFVFKNKVDKVLSFNDKANELDVENDIDHTYKVGYQEDSKKVVLSAEENNHYTGTDSKTEIEMDDKKVSIKKDGAEIVKLDDDGIKVERPYIPNSRTSVKTTVEVTNNGFAAYTEYERGSVTSKRNGWSEITAEDNGMATIGAGDLNGGNRLRISNNGMSYVSEDNDGNQYSLLMHTDTKTEAYHYDENKKQLVKTIEIKPEGVSDVNGLLAHEKDVAAIDNKLLTLASKQPIMDELVITFGRLGNYRKYIDLTGISYYEDVDDEVTYFRYWSHIKIAVAEGGNVYTENATGPYGHSNFGYFVNNEYEQLYTDTSRISDDAEYMQTISVISIDASFKSMTVHKFIDSLFNNVYGTDIEVAGNGSVVELPESVKKGYGEIGYIGGKSTQVVLANDSLLSSVSSGDNAIWWSQPSELINGVEYTLSYFGTPNTRLVVKNSSYGAVINIGVGEYITFTFTDSKYIWYIQSPSSMTNVSWKFNVVNGNTPATTYYDNVGITFESPLTINKVGKNLLDTNNWDYETGYGINVTKSNGSFIVNGSTENYPQLRLGIIELPAGTYNFGKGIDNQYIYLWIGTERYDNSLVNVNYLYKTFSLNKPTKLYVSMVFVPGHTFNNTIVYPMLNRGDTALPYEPYQATTLYLEKAVRAVGKKLMEDYHFSLADTADWLGFKINDNCKNELQLANGKGVVPVGIVNLGDLNYSGSNGRYYAIISNVKKSNVNASDNNVEFISSTGYEKTTVFGIANSNKTIAIGNIDNTNHGIYIKDTSYSSADALKSSLNGKVLLYELATPIEVTLIEESAVNPFINVAAGDSLIFLGSKGTPVEVDYSTRPSKLL